MLFRCRRSLLKLKRLTRLGVCLRQTSHAGIKEQAVGLGFQKVGIVPAEALIPEQARLSEWLARGYHGEMAGWLAILRIAPLLEIFSRAHR